MIDRNARVRYKLQRQQLERQMDCVVAEAFRNRTPKVLYHYTSERGLDGILTSRCLRCTEYRAFREKNGADGAELQHADSLIVEAARSLRAESSHYKVQAAVDQFLSMYEAQRLAALEDTEFYIGCFSHTSANAHLWQNYATPHGYCIGFQTLDDERHDPAGGLEASVFEVEYSAEKQRERVLAAFEGATKLFARALKAIQFPELMHLERPLLRIAAKANICFKAPSFAPEMEHRVLIMNPVSKVQPRQSFFDWPFRPEKRAPVLASVHVGYAAGSVGKRHVQELLQSLQYGADGMPLMPPIEIAAAPIP